MVSRDFLGAFGGRAGRGGARPRPRAEDVAAAGARGRGESASALLTAGPAGAAAAAGWVAVSGEAGEIPQWESGRLCCRTAPTVLISPLSL
jgi:hypothetical protein